MIPQNIPGESSKEKKVKVTGDKKQIEVARELIKEVMAQVLNGHFVKFMIMQLMLVHNALYLLDVM